jgi:ABC-2 type transport system ATP-binding protein
MKERIEEIKAYFDHGDYSLAVRRMLDLSLDSGDSQIIRNAVNWSKSHHSLLNNEPRIAIPQLFFEQFDKLVEQLAALSINPSSSPEILVEAREICKTYSSGNFSLSPINLQLKSTQVMGVVGENGNGKTTLLRCMAGQLALDSGEIIYPQLENPDNYQIKNHVAFIEQRIPKWYGLLKDNLHFSAALAGILGKTNELMVDFMLERFNLSRYAHLTWDRISSGYRTRFEIARILLQKPSLLILDEPLANLDINAQQTILTDLQFIAKSAMQPMGIILSSQQLHEVEKVADTVLFIKNGKCLFRTGDEINDTPGFTLEIETTADRNSLVSVLANEAIHVKFNGGFYTISSEQIPVHDLLKTLLKHDVPISYFRDITHSTKRFFN